MAGDIMSTLPLATNQPTRRMRDDVDFTVGLAAALALAHAAGPAEPAVDQRRPKAPLRHQEPHRGGKQPAQREGCAAPREPQRRSADAAVRRREGRQRQRRPQPARFHEVHVDGVGLAREVGGRVGRCEGLLRCVVVRPVYGGVERRAQRAEEQRCWVDEQEEGFERRGEKGCQGGGPLRHAAFGG